MIVIQYYLLMLMVAIWWLTNTGQVVVIRVNNSILLYSVNFQVNVGWADGPFAFVTAGNVDVAFEWDDTLPTFDIEIEDGEEV